MTPIERMIDKACGVKPEYWQRHFVLLKCPKCKAEKRVYRHSSDPKSAVAIEAACPKCGPVETIRYFDAAGLEVIVFA